MTPWSAKYCASEEISAQSEATSPLIVSSPSAGGQSIAYAESAESGRSILDHRPDLGRDYLELAAEVLSRTGLTGWRRKLTPLLTAA